MTDSKKLKVLLTTNIPSPYMVDYLDCLGKKCELTALFEMESATDRDKQWYGTIQSKSFRSVFLNAKRITAETGLSFRILKYIKRDFDRIIIANPTTPTGIIALLYCRFKKIPFVLQSEGGFRGSGKGIKERFKKYLMEKADFYLSGMKGEADYFLSYGATEETLRWYPFTSLKQEQIDHELLSMEEKAKIREELGIKENQVVISVGRPIPCKGFDVLLQAKKGLSEDVGVYIVGGTVSSDFAKIIEENDLQNVHFIDHCDFATLKKYYHAADVFVLPTRGDTWGLVINEAMASGLPVITTERCVAGTQLIENDVNGYIIPVDRADVLCEKIHLLLNDEEKRKTMAENNLEKIQPYYIENMANRVFQHLIGEETTAR